MRAVLVRGKRVMRGQPSERDAELRMHFYGRATVEITIDGNDASRPMTISVPRDEFVRMVLGQILAPEISSAHVDPGLAMQVWKGLWKGLGG